MTIEELEAELTATITTYAAQLSHVKTFKLDRLRLEIQGENIGVMFDRSAPDGMPTLVVQIMQATDASRSAVETATRWRDKK